MSFEIIRKTALNYYYGEGMTLARQYLRARVESGDITWEEHRRIMVGLLHLAGVDLSLATI
jgi:hypothetical protein